MRYNRQSGFTLIEVITTLVVLSVAAAAILSMFSNTIRSSANPVIQQQAVSIAEAYLEEILLKRFTDPDGVGGEIRSNFDNVGDYDGLVDIGSRDQNDTPIPSLADYTVSVTVSNTSLNGIVAADALLVTVSVDHKTLEPIVLQGFKTDY